MSETASILETSILELPGGEFIPVETNLLLDQRPVLIVGSNLYRADSGDDFEGIPVVVILERTGIAAEGTNRDGSIRVNPSSSKLLREVWPIIKGTPGTIIEVYAGFQQNHAQENVVWQGPFEFIVGQTVSVEPLVEGVFLGLRFRSEDQPAWDLLGVKLDIEVTGVPFA